MMRFLKTGTLDCLCVVAILVLSAGFAFSQPAPLADFDAYVADAVRDWEVPGLAIAIVKDGQVVFAKGYGVRELGRPEPVDEHTLFAIGSTTKAMTAAAVGMLVDEGKLQWDDRVTNHLPEFQLYDPYVTREVTVRDLLTHRAGLGNADFLWYGQDNSRREILRRLRYVEPETSLRSHFTYQNIMYTAAGEVVASVGGMPWEAYVRLRILDRLGMKDTAVLLAETEDKANVASPHDRVEGKIRVIANASVDAIAPAGSIWSSVSDMAKWMSFLLESRIPESPGGETLLEATSLEELFAPQVIVGTEEFYPTARLTRPKWTTYGLGWFQHDYMGRGVDFHTGSIDGMVAIIGLIRAERLGVYVLGNLDHAEVRHALMYRVFDLYGSHPPRDWSAELLELYTELRTEAEAGEGKTEGERVSGTQPSLPVASYAGSYSDSLHGTVVVTSDGQGRLMMRYGTGFVGELEHWHYDTFRASWEAEWRGKSFVTFVLGSKGLSTSMQFRGWTLERLEPMEVE